MGIFRSNPVSTVCGCLASAHSCSCWTSHSRFCSPVVVIRTSNHLGQLSTRVWSVAVGICTHSAAGALVISYTAVTGVLGCRLCCSGESHPNSESPTSNYIFMYNALCTQTSSCWYSVEPLANYNATAFTHPVQLCTFNTLCGRSYIWARRSDRYVVVAMYSIYLFLAKCSWLHEKYPTVVRLVVVWCKFSLTSSRPWCKTQDVKPVRASPASMVLLHACLMVLLVTWYACMSWLSAPGLVDKHSSACFGLLKWSEWAEAVLAEGC